MPAIPQRRPVSIRQCLKGPSALLAVQKTGLEPRGQFLQNEVRVILNLFVESKDLELVTDSLVKLSEVTDVYEVTGEYDIVCLLRTESILAFREVLKNKILKIPGVKSTVSSIVLYTHKRSEEHTSELQSLTNLVCRLLLEKKNEKLTRSLA